MSVATSTAIAIGAGVSAAGAIGGAAIGANAAGNAASVQANAAKSAAQLQYEAQQQALQFQEGVYNNDLSLQSPYYSAGVSGLTNLENLLGILPASASTTAIPQPRPINVPGLPNPAGGPAQQFNPGSVPSPQPGGPSLPASAQRVAESPGVNTVGGTRQFNPGSVPNVPQSGAVIANGGQPIYSGQANNPAAYPRTGTPATPGTAGTPPPNSLTSLINPQLGSAGSLMTPFLTPFQAPTAATEQNDPGYQFRLNQGMQALQNSAAARGDLLSGNFAQGAEQFGQDYASNEYGNVYNRALQQYQLAQNNSTNIFNRLADISGLGQTALQQITNAGATAGGQVGSTLINSAGMMGQDYQNAAAATASGYIGSANAYGGALNSIGSYAGSLAFLPYLQQLLQGNSNPYSASGLNNYPIPSAPTDVMEAALG